jgi:tetratricopeptide (TPR) repeat protein
MTQRMTSLATIFRSGTVVLGVTLLAACASQPPAPVEDRSVAEQVRAPAPAAEDPRGLQVYPLRNPAVTELTEAARSAEAENDLDRATILLERALRIEPRDPELLQYMAEVQLDKGEWSQAENYASRSFDVGPRVGELCQRNWRTMALARERQGRDDAARQARDRLDQCRVEAPERF